MSGAYAVIFTYSFDEDTPVYLFDTEQEAVDFLRDSFMEEKRIDEEENGWNIEAEISDDGWYAKIVKIVNIFEDEDNDITEFRIGQVYSIN